MTELIKDLPDGICWKLSSTLDRVEKPNWKTLINKMPRRTYDDKTINKFHMAIIKPHGSPTMELLTDLGKKKKRISELIQWLNDIGTFPELVELITRGGNPNQDDPPIIISQPRLHVVCKENEACMLRFELSAATVGNTRYQWFKATHALPHQTFKDLNITDASSDDAGYYICRIANEIGCVFTNWCKIEVTEAQDNLLNMLNQPLITMHPRSVLLHTGQTLQLSADAAGTPPPRLQWFYNDNILTGQCSRDLMINDINPDLHDGFYKLCATNKFGTVCSLAAQVIINKALPIECVEASMKSLNINNTNQQQSLINSNDHQFFEQARNPRGPERLRSTNTSCSIHSITNPSVKVALLIGNQNYEYKGSLGPLVHPVNDTLDIAAALMSINFKVVSLINLDLASMKQALEFFYSIIETASYALFYFAGHGFEIEGKNYLMPVDATGRYAPHENLPLSDVLLAVTNKRAKLSVLLIDSCRTDPMNCRKDPIQKVISVLSDRPTDPIERKNVIIGYGCCSSGRVLESPLMKNGYYAQYLAEYITQDMKVDDVLYEVSKAINQERIVDPATGRTQVVYRHSTVVDEFKLTDSPNASYTPSASSLLWQEAHNAPDSPVTILSNDILTVKLVFTAECSNCLLVQGDIIKKTNDFACNLDFVMSDKIGGSTVEIITETEKDMSRKCVRISNLELLQGDIQIHIIIRFNGTEKFASYTIKEKPLYAKIVGAMKVGSAVTTSF